MERNLTEKAVVAVGFEPTKLTQWNLSPPPLTARAHNLIREPTASRTPPFFMSYLLDIPPMKGRVRLTVGFLIFMKNGKIYD